MQQALGQNKSEQRLVVHSQSALLFCLRLYYYVFLCLSENGPRLSVDTAQPKVISQRGGNATLQCKFTRDPTSPPNPKLRIKWTKLTSDYLKEIDVFVAMGFHKKSYGRFHGRVYLQAASKNDASLVITDITLEDYGKYKCEVIDGLEDDTAVVSLDLQGKASIYVANITCWIFLVSLVAFSHALQQHQDLDVDLYFVYIFWFRQTW